jgi:hemerythrin superfamily protein
MATTRRSTPRAKDAIAMLRADHRLVNDLFAQFEKARSPERKRGLAQQICQELTVHAQLEEELFYPAAKAALRDKELVPEARVEHETIKRLIEQISEPNVDGEDFDARVKVLAEYVKHHVKEEQGELFPKVKASKLDLVAMGEALQARRDELLVGEQAVGQ